jgi:hypothetical protein
MHYQVFFLMIINLDFLRYKRFKQFFMKYLNNNLVYLFIS